MEIAGKFLSKYAKHYPHAVVNNLCENPNNLTLPTNKYLALSDVQVWFTNAIFQPISVSARPEACIKYTVFSVINCLSGRLLEAEYPSVDPYFAINRESYLQVYSEWHDSLIPTDGQFKLAVILLDKFAQLKNKQNMDKNMDKNRNKNMNNNHKLDQFLCEEFFNYLTPYQLLLIQGVLGCHTVTGHAMWQINEKTASLFNTPDDQEYKFITPRQMGDSRTAHCDESYKPYYIPSSICTLFSHMCPSLTMTISQFYDGINILDMPCSLSEQIDRYLWTLTPEQSNIVYL